MYQYDEIDQRMVDERVAQFRDQTARFLSGALSEDAFRPLRLRNGLYIQRHAPMLRVAIPYGLLSAVQLRKLAHIARTYDRGSAHFSTRQNIQYNGPALERVPDLLAELATVQMHAIQTSGNCVRNVTSDHFAGVAPDEIVNSLIWSELIRQWSTFHPEFNWLPRKFKIAVNGAAQDRAAILVHDIGLSAVLRDGAVGFEVWVGGGLGRMPMVGSLIREFLPWQHLLTYLEAILRVYNRAGRRDNLHKARIKVLVRERGVQAFRDAVEAEWAHLADGPATLTEAELARISARFTVPAYERLEVPADPALALAPGAERRAFARWRLRNTHAHKVRGYAAVSLSLKRAGMAPGDITAPEMDAVAQLAERYGFGELRVSHEQNLILPDVRIDALAALWRELSALGLATPNIGLLTNIICCPGGDFCALANARSIPIAEAIRVRFEDLDRLFEIGELDLNISGCMNACGHHHIGHIGILGVDKGGEEWYQIEIGGQQGRQAALGRPIGRAFAASEVPQALEALVRHYLAVRTGKDERFIDAVRRLGADGFKQAVYGDPDQQRTDPSRALAVA
jgi:sulfite reductase (NADPH) hemoprotein beta-component